MQTSSFLHGKIIYLLIAVVSNHFLYPLSEINQTASTIYVFFYCILIGIGGYVTSIDQKRLVLSTIFTVGATISGILWAITSNDRTINIYLWMFYIILIIDLLIICYTLLEFIFLSEMINRNVLMAGVTLYMLIGNLFTPIYLFLNAIYFNFTEMNAFGLHTRTIDLTWQRMYYFSLTTLTTLGYGDISPVASFVEPFVTAESIIGVLYVAILMARLVSLYDQHKAR